MKTISAVKSKAKIAAAKNKIISAPKAAKPAVAKKSAVEVKSAPVAKPVAVAKSAVATKPIAVTKPATPEIQPVAKPAKVSAPKATGAIAPRSLPEVPSEQIARCAYIIWEQQGRPNGKDSEHWQMAEQQLKNTQSFTE